MRYDIKLIFFRTWPWPCFKSMQFDESAHFFSTDVHYDQGYLLLKQVQIGLMLSLKHLSAAVRSEVRTVSKLE